tara:strand:- start:49 stop:243 length:195 start_codon:yes stop_codon:yes gene_type:complete
MKKKLDDRTIELLKKFASSPAGKMKHDSTGFPEIDEMIDKAAERIAKANPSLVEALKEKTPNED